MKNTTIYSICTLALLTFMLNSSCLGDAANSLSIEIKSLPQPVLVKEILKFQIEVLNKSDRPVQIPKLRNGYRSGLVQISLVQPDGVLVPHMRGQFVPAKITDWQTLSAKSSMVWTTDQISSYQYSLNKPGKYVLRVIIAQRGERPLRIEKAVEVLPYQATTVIKVFRAPLLGAKWGAGADDYGEVDAASIGERHWLFYRRTNRFGDVVVERLGELALEDEFIAVCRLPVFEVAWKSVDGSLKLVRINAEDGFRVPEASHD